MKYMGSKRAMLAGGLLDAIHESLRPKGRFFDLFSGSGAVATSVAMRWAVPVIASDLQEFAAVLAGAIVERTEVVSHESIWEEWLRRSEVTSDELQGRWVESATARDIYEAREWCRVQDGEVTKAYGGHYFAPQQAAMIDALRKAIPSERGSGMAALGALIRAASRCAAAPGHTAQPFQPTASGMRYLKAAWKRDILERTRVELAAIGQAVALRKGRAVVASAIDVVEQAGRNDLLFLDPPYSHVQYSRFYHVLETIAKGSAGDVSGVGRYPSRFLRPTSEFSMRSKSDDAMRTLLAAIAKRKARAIITFPDHECSNGLSGDRVKSIASEFFRVDQRVITSNFSTLGGGKLSEASGAVRPPRRLSRELILLLS